MIEGNYIALGTSGFTGEIAAKKAPPQKGDAFAFVLVETKVNR